MSPSLLENITIGPVPARFSFGMEEWIEPYFRSTSSRSSSTLVDKARPQTGPKSNEPLQLQPHPNAFQQRSSPTPTPKTIDTRPIQRRTAFLHSARKNWKDCPNLAFQKTTKTLQNGHWKTSSPGWAPKRVQIVQTSVLSLCLKTWIQHNSTSGYQCWLLKQGR